ENHIVFANSNERAIDEFLNFLKPFNLKTDFYLEISIKNKSKKFIEKSVNFWENYLNIKLKRVRLRKEFNNTTEHGTIHILVNNALFSKMFKQIIDLSKNKIERKKVLSIGYIKGIIAAEGNINIKKKTDCVYMVRISASKNEERSHYKRCLKRIGINIFCKDMPTISKQEGISKGWKTDKGRAGAVIISRWDNFIKILQMDLLELNKHKENKFLKYLKNNKFTKQFMDFSIFINKEFTMKQAQSCFNLSGRHVNRLLTLWKNGYTTKKLIKNKHIWKLNKNYINLYNKLKIISDRSKRSPFV
ncbi:hypothetical protein J4427_03175, partial [Candidatus Woesearchaeota archaeon]|nr:hypothetical protein [Candidatus Woesearchaeota archaeon]